MYCKNCGKELLENSTVCFECGATTNFVAPNATQNVVTPATQNVVTPAPTQNVVTPTATSIRPSGPVEVKSKKRAAIFAILLGGCGVHDFYLGFIKRGIIKILLSIVSFGFAGAIWGVVDFIRIVAGGVKTDAKGNPVM